MHHFEGKVYNFNFNNDCSGNLRIHAKEGDAATLELDAHDLLRWAAYVVGESKRWAAYVVGESKQAQFEAALDESTAADILGIPEDMLPE